MSTLIDMVGKKFNRLTVLARSQKKTFRVKWDCRCDCGNVVAVDGNSLRSGNTKSCGCRKLEATKQMGLSRRTHGLTGCPEYKAWHAMKDRCHKETHENYDNYGARGITVCPEWFGSFESFYRDMGPRPGKEYSIDRKDVNGHYEPDNCRWATAEEQSNNKRLNKYFEVDGEKLTLSQLSRKYNVPLPTLTSRVYRDNLSIDEALKKKASRHTAHLNGVSKRLHVWAKELNISYFKIYHFVNTHSSDLKELVGGLEN